MTSHSKLKSLSLFMAYSCIFLMAFLSVSTLWFWSNFKTNAKFLDIYKNNVLQLETIDSWQIMLAALFSGLTVAVSIFGLIHLRRLFISFRDGHFFNQESVRSMHFFCTALFISVLFKLLNSAFLSVVLTWNNGPGQKALIVQFGSNELWLLFFAITFLAIAWSFKEGLRLSQENEGFI